MITVGNSRGQPMNSISLEREFLISSATHPAGDLHDSPAPPFRRCSSISFSRSHASSLLLNRYWRYWKLRIKVSYVLALHIRPHLTFVRLHRQGRLSWLPQFPSKSTGTMREFPTSSRMFLHFFGGTLQFSLIRTSTSALDIPQHLQIAL